LTAEGGFSALQHKARRRAEPGENRGIAQNLLLFWKLHKKQAARVCGAIRGFAPFLRTALLLVLHFRQKPGYRHGAGRGGDGLGA